MQRMNNQVRPLYLDALFNICRNLKGLVYQNEDEFTDVKNIARLQNPWFEVRDIDRMLDSVFNNYLNEEKFAEWILRYSLKELKVKKVIGIVAAGNIPLASFQDVWCALTCGFSVQLKMSSRDEVLSKFIYDKLNQFLEGTNCRIDYVDKLSDIDALIASGNHLTTNHFQKFESRFPCLVRSHRNSVAVLSGHESDQELIALGEDVFSYFGLGCRNVTKVYVPDQSVLLKLARLFDDHFLYVRDHSKYNNNYEYQHAILCLNQSVFYQANSILFRESSNINSAIAVLNFEVYESLMDLQDRLITKLDNIQCVCSNINGLKLKTTPLGKAQWPELWDYQDHIDLIHFLQKIAE